MAAEVLYAMMTAPMITNNIIKVYQDIRKRQALFRFEVGYL